MSKRVVVFTSELAVLREFWLTRGYAPEVGDGLVGKPALQAQADAISARIEPVLIPWDCVDGF